MTRFAGIVLAALALAGCDSGTSSSTSPGGKKKYPGPSQPSDSTKHPAPGPGVFS